MLQPGRCSIAVVLSLGLAAGPGCWTSCCPAYIFLYFAVLCNTVQRFVVGVIFTDICLFVYLLEVWPLATH